MNCELSAVMAENNLPRPRRFRITDKHGISRHAYNLKFAIDGEKSQVCTVGLADESLPGKGAAAQETVNGHSMADLKDRAEKRIVED